jgi:predicted porin
MKKTIAALAVLSMASGIAAAQSAVTIYGLFDVALVRESGGAAGSMTKLTSGIGGGSRLGFKGTEDIGGGYKAIINLEMRVELDTGNQQPTLLSDQQGLYLTKGMGAFPAPVLSAIRSALQPKGQPAINPANAIFDRTSMVGLITPAGAVMLGRMYTPGYEVLAAADAFESGTAGTWGGILGGTAGFTALGGDIRSQNSIQYRIATPAGFGGSVMYGFKDSGYIGYYNKFYGAAATYKANGWDIGIAHNRGYAQNDAVSLVTSTIGGSYTLGDFKLFAGYHDMRNHNSVMLPLYIAGYDTQVAPALAPLGAATQAALRNVFVTNITKNSQYEANSVQFGLHYRMGQGRIMTSVARQNDRTPSNSDTTMFAIGYDYNLSKRTDIYTVAALFNNSNDGQFIPGASGAPGGFTKVPGENTRAYQVGMRYRF